ncbi:MAG: hypothetical protein Q8O95_05830 [bacterium]|nr:hypothetical protein [bacterium]
MKKSLKLFLVISLSLSVLTACNKNSNEDPQTVINNAWEKLADKQAAYEIGKINFDGRADLDYDGSKANLKGNGELQFDSSDKENPVSALKLDLDGKGSFEGSEGSVELTGEIRTIKNTLYLMLESLNIDTGDAQTNLMANLVGNLYKGQWISIPNPTEEAKKAFDAENFKGKAVAEVARKNNFFELKKDLGNRKYELQINAEKLKTYLREVSKVNGQELSAEDLMAVDEVLKTLVYSFQVGIGNDYELTWLKGDFTVNNPETDLSQTGEIQTMNLSFEVDLKDSTSQGTITLNIGGDTPGSFSTTFSATHEKGGVSIEIPADAQNFDPEALLGGGMPGLMPSTEGMPGMEGVPNMKGMPNIEEMMENMPQE